MPTPRLVQILFNGTYIVRTTSACYVWEHPYYPYFYVPYADLLESSQASHGAFALLDGEPIHDAAGHIVAHACRIRVHGKVCDRVLEFYQHEPGPASQLDGLVRIEFGAMDRWFEESVPIFVHPKDPFKRLDLLASERHVKVSLRGHVLAETTASVHLYETGLPCRFYLPLTSCDVTVLRASRTRTQCPYKGEAEYYSVVLGEGEGQVVEDVAWFYNRPTLEVAGVVGLVSRFPSQYHSPLRPSPFRFRLPRRNGCGSA